MFLLDVERRETGLALKSSRVASIIPWTYKSLSALSCGLPRTKCQKDNRPMYTPWHFFLTKDIPCPLGVPPRIHLYQVWTYQGVCQVQTCMQSIYASVCVKTTWTHASMPRILTIRKSMSNMDLWLSPEMPVKKCSSWFRGGSDVPECMWWTWICPGFPHIHSGASAASSLDVGESYLKQSSIQWKEWSSNFFFGALDNLVFIRFFSKIGE